MKASFTLVETIIAALIVVTALVGIISLLFYSYSAGGEANQYILAISLAREGIEVIRGIRESNWLALRNWNDNLAEGTYIANYDSTSLTNTTGGSTIQTCTNCYLCLIDGRYVHCLSESSYKRMLRIENISSDEILVSSEVLWWTKTGERTIKLQQILTNWR